jgi:hypothetical protein
MSNKKIDDDDDITSDDIVRQHKCVCYTLNPTQCLYVPENKLLEELNNFYSLRLLYDDHTCICEKHTDLIDYCKANTTHVCICDKTIHINNTDIVQGYEKCKSLTHKCISHVNCKANYKAHNFVGCNLYNLRFIKNLVTEPVAEPVAEPVEPVADSAIYFSIKKIRFVIKQTLVFYCFFFISFVKIFCN